jgi:hypothetical protein
MSSVTQGTMLSRSRGRNSISCQAGASQRHRQYDTAAITWQPANERLHAGNILIMPSLLGRTAGDLAGCRRRLLPSSGDGGRFYLPDCLRPRRAESGRKVGSIESREPFTGLMRSTIRRVMPIAVLATMLVIVVAVTPVSLAMPIAIYPVAILVSIAIMVCVGSMVRRNDAAR